MEVDQKSMSLADIIKKDKAAGKGGNVGNKFGDKKNRGRGANQDKRAPPKQANGQNLMKARRTDAGIHKTKPFRSGGPNLTREQRKNRQQQVNQPAGGAPRQNFKSGGQANPQRRFEQRKPLPSGRGQGPPSGGQNQRPQSSGQGASNGPRSGVMRQRGGLARGGARQMVARPKNQMQQRTIRLVDKKPLSPKVKQWQLSDRRLKVRNFDDKQVTNDDLKKLFAKIGDIKICKFDRNEFGQFLGSATVTYERPEDAKQAIDEYNGAFLDEKVLVVEYDMVMDRNQGGGKGPVNLVQKQNSSNKGKTLNLANNR